MNKDKLEIFKTIISSNGHRVTAARLALFELLIDTEPLSIQQILQKASTAIDRVGVYRNIELYESLGIVRKVTIGWKYKIELSEKFVAHHHHLVCIKCGDITDIHSEEKVERFIDQVSKDLSFTPVSHQFEIEGYCQKCRN
jgi:Fur family ferric uptake transcriptional regulator